MRYQLYYFISAPLSLNLFIYLFGVLHRFQHCTGHITMGSWKGRGNQYIEFAKVLYCNLLTNGKQLPAFPLEAVPGIEPRPQRWETRVLPLCHRGPSLSLKAESQISDNCYSFTSSTIQISYDDKNNTYSVNFNYL